MSLYTIFSVDSTRMPAQIFLAILFTLVVDRKKIYKYDLPYHHVTDKVKNHAFVGARWGVSKSKLDN